MLSLWDVGMEKLKQNEMKKLTVRHAAVVWGDGHQAIFWETS
jgi:hypothetical protein